MIMNDDNQPSNYPSISLLKNISKAQGLVRFILDNQREHMLQTGSVTALDAVRDTLRALNLAQNDLTDLIDQHRDERENMIKSISAR